MGKDDVIYEITIKRTQNVRKVLGKSWAKVGQEEKARDRQYCSGEIDPKTYMSDVYGYTPETESTATESVEILKQVVANLDMATVLKAINNL
jgi:hypothetical protein